MKKGLNNIYCLKCDISKYFKNIDHKILFSLINKKIKDKRLLNLIKKIIDSNYENKNYRNLFEYDLAGIPIGNLTSQLFANIYLNELDQFVKHKLREKCYIRYMDDFLILSPDKKRLGFCKKEIKNFIESRLKLKLHPKKAEISKINQGIDFLGYRLFGDYRLLRKDTVKRFKKRTKKHSKLLERRRITEEKFNNSINSWIAYADFANSYNLKQKLFKNLP